MVEIKAVNINLIEQYNKTGSIGGLSEWLSRWLNLSLEQLGALRLAD